MLTPLIPLGGNSKKDSRPEKMAPNPINLKKSGWSPKEKKSGPTFSKEAISFPNV